MNDMVLGVYSDREDADKAVDELKESGFETNNISVIKKKTETETKGGMAAGSPIGGMVSGVTGGVLGGVAGLLAGVSAVVVPGVGALLVGGPLASTVTGSLSGGLVGVLGDIGLSGQEAKTYEEKIQKGAVFLAVMVDENNKEEARRILESNNADQVKYVSSKS